jgi:hypothetical protein
MVISSPQQYLLRRRPAEAEEVEQHAEVFAALQQPQVLLAGQKAAQIPWKRGRIWPHNARLWS